MKTLVPLIIIQGQESAYCDRCSAEPTACRKVSDTFAVTVMSKGYNPVVNIPVGACFINVTEKERSQNYLALKTERSGYFLNGMWKMNSPGTYRGAGSDFQYARAVGTCPGDCIYSKGPIREALVVMLLYHNVSPGIDYSYEVPHHLDRSSYTERPNMDDITQPTTVDTQSGYDQRDTAVFNDQSDQTQGRSALTDSTPRVSASRITDDVDNPTAGISTTSYRRRTDSGADRRSSGRRRRPIFSSDFRRPRPRIVSRKHETQRRHKSARGSLREVTYSRQVVDSSEQERPEVSARLDPASRLISIDSGRTSTGVLNEVAINGAEQYVWRVSGYTVCSSTCAGGVQEQILQCTDVRNGVPVSARYCQDTIRPEIRRVVCNEAPCIPNWETSNWSPCSTSCGPGQQTRSVICQQRISSTVIRNMTSEECLNRKPEESRRCFNPSCYYWAKSAWSDCSVLCGSGIRTRRVECQNEAGQEFNDSLCSQSKPRTFRSCDLGSCTRHWYYSNWNNLCSEDCGSGIMSRKVHCVTDSGRVLPDDQCDSNKKPGQERQCSRNVPCRGRWFTGPWSQCSVSCGAGMRQRQATCMQKLQDGSLQVLDSSQCPRNEKPDTEELCTQAHCGTLWYMTDWSKCSVTCGGGIKQRHVQCLNNEMEYSTLCSQSERPADKISCNTERCWTRPRPTNSGCIDKYPNCAVVVQTRLCRYPYYQRNCCRSCSGRI